MPQNIHPTGLVGCREAISAPIVGYASASIPVSTAKVGPGLRWGASGGRTGPLVRKSRKRARPMSTTHTAHNDQANQGAVRRRDPPILRSCLLAPFVTTFSLQDGPLQGTASGVKRKYLANFRELRSCELLRNHLPRIWVHGVGYLQTMK